MSSKSKPSTLTQRRPPLPRPHQEPASGDPQARGRLPEFPPSERVVFTSSDSTLPRERAERIGVESYLSVCTNVETSSSDRCASIANPLSGCWCDTTIRVAGGIDVRQHYWISKFRLTTRFSPALTGCSATSVQSPRRWPPPTPIGSPLSWNRRGACSTSSGSRPSGGDPLRRDLRQPRLSLHYGRHDRLGFATFDLMGEHYLDYDNFAALCAPRLRHRVASRAQTVLARTSRRVEPRQEHFVRPAYLRRGGPAGRGTVRSPRSAARSSNTQATTTCSTTSSPLPMPRIFDGSYASSQFGWSRTSATEAATTAFSSQRSSRSQEVALGRLQEIVHKR
jgi:hypothetical protein